MDYTAIVSFHASLEQRRSRGVDAPFESRGTTDGRVAQLVRALVSHTRGPGFESLRDHCAPCPGALLTQFPFYACD
jgi:hypothetical protein